MFNIYDSRRFIKTEFLNQSFYDNNHALEDPSEEVAKGFFKKKDQDNQENSKYKFKDKLFSLDCEPRTKKKVDHASKILSSKKENLDDDEEVCVVSEILDAHMKPFIKTLSNKNIRLVLDQKQRQHIQSKNPSVKTNISFLGKSYSEYSKFFKIIVQDSSITWSIKNTSQNNDEMQNLLKQIEGKSLYEIMVFLLENNLQQIEIGKLKGEMNKEHFKTFWKKIKEEFQDIDLRQKHGSLIDAHKMNTKNGLRTKSESEKYFEELLVKKGLEIDFYFIKDIEDFAVHFYEGT